MDTPGPGTTRVADAVEAAGATAALPTVPGGAAADGADSPARPTNARARCCRTNLTVLIKRGRTRLSKTLAATDRRTARREIVGPPCRCTLQMWPEPQIGSGAPVRCADWRADRATPPADLPGREHSIPIHPPCRIATGRERARGSPRSGGPGRRAPPAWPPRSPLRRTP